MTDIQSKLDALYAALPANHHDEDHNIDCGTPTTRSLKETMAQLTTSLRDGTHPCLNQKPTSVDENECITDEDVLACSKSIQLTKAEKALAKAQAAVEAEKEQLAAKLAAKKVKTEKELTKKPRQLNAKELKHFVKSVFEKHSLFVSQDRQSVFKEEAPLKFKEVSFAEALSLVAIAVETAIDNCHMEVISGTHAGALATVVNRFIITTDRLIDSPFPVAYADSEFPSFIRLEAPVACHTLFGTMLKDYQSRMRNFDVLAAWVYALGLPLANRRQSPFIWGKGGTGKSVFLTVLEKIYGDTMISWSGEELKQVNQFRSSSLENKRILSVCEDAGLGWIRSSEFKTMADSKISVQRKGKDRHSIHQTHMTILTSNTEPFTKGLEEVRSRIIDCYLEKPEVRSPQTPDQLAYRLMKEWSHLLAYGKFIYDKCEGDLMSITDCSHVDQQSDNDAQDLIASVLVNYELTGNDSDMISSVELRNAYKACAGHAYSDGKYNVFCRSLTSCKSIRKKVQGKLISYWTGIKPLTNTILGE